MKMLDFETEKQKAHEIVMETLGRYEALNGDFKGLHNGSYSNGKLDEIEIRLETLAIALEKASPYVLEDSNYKLAKEKESYFKTQLKQIKNGKNSKKTS